VRAEQVGLHPEQVPIAAGVLEHGLDARVLLDEHGERERAHARPARTFRDVHHVHAADAQHARAGEHVLTRVAARRRQLDDRDEAAAGERVREERLFRARHDRAWPPLRIRRDAPCHARLGRRTRKDALSGIRRIRNDARDGV
jgi:hypothetical protein